MKTSFHPVSNTARHWQNPWPDKNMGKEKTGAQLKQTLAVLLAEDDFEAAMNRLRDFPAKKTVNVLIAFLCHLDQRIRWRSVSALGVLISAMSKLNPEEGRIIMRRFMWMLNEESGGIGWGVPEAMGEVLYRSSVLDLEYHRILLSYLDEQGNFLDHAPLRQGVLWAMARISRAKPHLMKDGAHLARAYLASENPVDRGLSCLIAGYLDDRNALPLLENLSMDKTEITLYIEGDFSRCTIGGLAGKALIRLS